MHHVLTMIEVQECVCSTEVSQRTNGLSYESSGFTKCCEEQLRKVCGCRPNFEV